MYNCSHSLVLQSSYRINTEKIVKHRMAVITQHANDYEAAEEAIGCGQVEELIEQAQDELDLIPVLIGMAFEFFIVSPLSLFLTV